MKKLNLLLTALLLMCCVGTAKAVEVTIDGIKYDVITDTKQATVISGDTKYSGDIVIPSEITYNNVTYSVTSIGNNAFRDCDNLTSITIPNSVTSIGNKAFAYCKGLESIVVDPGNTKYDSRENCNAIIETESNALIAGCKNTVIPNSVTSIGYSAFYGRSELTSITIPNSVTSIGEEAFLDCSGLESIIVDPGNTKYDSRENCNAIIETESNALIAGCKNTVIPNSVTSIGSYAFYYCSGLESITIPNSVTAIGNAAFYDCYNLTSITIPNSVTSIGEWVFAYCKLTSITIPNSVTSIGDYAFWGCDGLTSVTIGSRVTSIGEKAFYQCSGLTSITIPNSVTSIGNNAFYGCSGLKEVHINDLAAWCNIDFEDSDANPLYYAHNLYLNNELITELVIPNGVTSIGVRAFYRCSGLTSVTIPNSVTSIGSGAFAYCSNLTDVYCLATDVPSTDSDAFYNSYPEYMTLHVPAASINNYKTKVPWSSFGNIVTLDGDIVETPKCDNPVIKYSNGELVIECETENAEFVTEVTSNDFKKFYSNKINFSATYNISVYATAAGYDNSDTANATLCWIECDCSANDNTSDVINVPAKAVFVTSNNGTINISCTLEGEVVELYTSDAMYIGSTTIENGCATIESGLSKGDIAIIKIAEKSIKVIVD